MSATTLKLRHRIANVVLRFAYYGRVPVLDLSTSDAEAHERPRLVIASHRNGAFDGQQVLAAFPKVQFLVSIQLLRHWFLRLFVAGIPVVRPKDVERYGLDPAAEASPVEAGCAHLRAGGDLGIFPEGSSDWGFRPQSYQRGAARIVCALAQEGLEVDVIPVGLFYSTPGRFRSRAQVVRGPSVRLPSRGDQGLKTWESMVAEELARALDEVSVNCPDQETFDRIQAQSLHIARTSKPHLASTRAVFARSFLQLQRDVAADRVSIDSLGAARGGHRVYAWWRWVCLVLMWVFAPVLAVAAFAGSRADARNTVTFFRMLGGAAAALIWIPVLIVLGFFFPWLMAAGLVCSVIGWLLLGMRRIRL
ncbi:MAG: hypothetical protein ACTIJJ_08665 [Galactobacter sp.]